MNCEISPVSMTQCSRTEGIPNNGCLAIGQRCRTCVIKYISILGDIMSSADNYSEISLIGTEYQSISFRSS